MSSWELVDLSVTEVRLATPLHRWFFVLKLVDLSVADVDLATPRR